jgi:membrane dipeptidase
VLTRRQTIGWLGAIGATAKLSPVLGSNHGYPEARYTKAIVIDGLGGPGEMFTGAPDDAPLSAVALTDARASGVTAVNVTVCEVDNGPDRFEKTVAAIAKMERELNAHPDFFLKVLRAADLMLAKSTRRMGLIFGFQDTSMLEGDLHRLEMFYALGLRICQPTYNRRNLMGDGCLEAADGGLSRLGLEFIAELDRLHILLDLSHAGRRTISEGIAMAKAPMAITHTGCRALVDVPRNTDDSSLRALADKGGVAGIYFKPFLHASGQAHADDVVRHLEHAVDVCGEDHVGVGTDLVVSAITVNDAFREHYRKFIEKRQKAGIAAPGESVDVFNFIPEYNEARRFKKLADDLAQRGWKTTRIEKILGANFARLFAEVWSA